MQTDLVRLLRLARHLAFGALVTLVLTSAVPAQDPGASPESPGATADTEPVEPVADPPSLRIQVQNLSPDDRSEWVRASIPFPRGLVKKQPSWIVRGDIESGEDTDPLPTVWQPFGARWPDGSWRQALCFFQATVPSLSSKVFRLYEGAPRSEPVAAFGLPPHALRFTATVGGETFLAELREDEILEQNAARKVQVFRGRFGDCGLVAELVLTLWNDQRHADLSIGAFFSDPRTEAMEIAIDELAIETDGIALALRHARPLGVESSLTELGTRHVLLREDSMSDGQGIRRVGILAPPLPADADQEALGASTLRAAALSPLVGAARWTDTGAFGPFGAVAEPPPWLRSRGLDAWLGQRHTAYAKWLRSATPDPFRAPKLGPHRKPGTAGNQADFGAAQLFEVAWSGVPSPLLETEWSVLQEACRPVHVYEVDATPVDPRNHPDWVVWTGRTHWNCKVSTDRLGKPCPEPRSDTHGWRGKDREHWSSNFLGAFYQLTGAPWALLELRREGDLYLAGETLRKDLFTSNPGAARAAGRSLHSAAWIWLATGDTRILDRMRARMVEVNLPHWQFADRDAGTFRPFDRKGPDRRYFPAADDAVWTPWEEALAVLGFEAYLRATEDPDESLRDFVDDLAINLLDHGYRISPDDRVEIGYVMRFNGGIPPKNDAERADETRVRWTPNFVHWGIPALVVAENALIRRGQDERAQRATLLLERLARDRRPPRAGGTDDMVRWDTRALRDRNR